MLATTITLNIRLLPIFPAGWFAAYWSRVTLCAAITAATIVSPKTICTAADVTGARLKGHISPCIGKCTFISHSFERGFPSTEVREIITAPLAFAQGTRERSSSDAPDFEIRIILSPSKTAPGWNCRKKFHGRSIIKLSILVINFTCNSCVIIMCRTCIWCQQIITHQLDMYYLI